MLKKNNFIILLILVLQNGCGEKGNEAVSPGITSSNQTSSRPIYNPFVNKFSINDTNFSSQDNKLERMSNLRKLSNEGAKAIDHAFHYCRKLIKKLGKNRKIALKGMKNKLESKKDNPRYNVDLFIFYEEDIELNNTIGDFRRNIKVPSAMNHTRILNKKSVNQANEMYGNEDDEFEDDNEISISGTSNSLSKNVILKKIITMFLEVASHLSALIKHQLRYKSILELIRRNEINKTQAITRENREPISKIKDADETIADHIKIINIEEKYETEIDFYESIEQLVNASKNKNNTNCMRSIENMNKHYIQDYDSEIKKPSIRYIKANN